MQIYREFRKSLSLQINDNGEVIVKAPLLLSQRKIDNFINSKSKWVNNQLNKLEASKSFERKFDFINNVYINGVEYAWKSLQTDKRRTKKSFYSQKCNDLLLKKAENIGQRINLYPQFKICSSVRIWGSCNAKKEIKLNWKVVILPEKLQNYIIYHELSHIKQMNHSPKFWQEVEYFIPDYKWCREELKKYGFLLKGQVL